jgi:predicted permease
MYFAVINAALPVFALILTGCVCARFKILGSQAMEGLNGFVIWLALPAQLFLAMAQVSLSELAEPGFFLGFAIAMFATSAIYLVAEKSKKTDSTDHFISAMSASYANAGFMGLPLCLMVFGPASIVPSVLSMLFSVCILFGTSILVIELKATQGQRFFAALRKLSAAMLRNPILIAPLLGLAWSQTHLPLPVAALRYFELIAAASTPAALISIGLFLAQVHNSEKTGNIGLIVFLKLLFQPIVTAVLCLWVFEVPRLWAMVAILMSALPIGSGPFMLARMYGRDPGTSAQAILISTLVSVPTVMLLIAWLS